MTLIRCHVANSAVTVLMVVPLHKAMHPFACRLNAFERLARVGWRIFQRTKQALRIRVVVGHPRPTKARIHPELAERATRLADDLGIPVEILNTSYLPEGYEQCDGVGGEDLLVPEATTTFGEALDYPATYPGLDPEDVDLFFVYPWPGQEELMMDLFLLTSTEDATRRSSFP